MHPKHYLRKSKVPFERLLRAKATQRIDTAKSFMENPEVLRSMGTLFPWPRFVSDVHKTQVNADSEQVEEKNASALPHAEGQVLNSDSEPYQSRLESKKEAAKDKRQEKNNNDQENGQTHQNCVDCAEVQQIINIMTAQLGQLKKLCDLAGQNGNQGNNNQNAGNVEQDQECTDESLLEFEEAII
ncbi:hypothetical protein BKA69DRAFT_1122948 [Paraphysoderma sedebokerense]|nr:hypothetical protein BKA69DRAFT_1122948 [Paraphysoderma sedebokerense]